MWDISFDVLTRIIGLASGAMSEVLSAAYYSVKFEFWLEEYGVQADSKLIILGDAFYNKVKKFIEIRNPKVISGQVASVIEYLSMKRHQKIFSFVFCGFLAAFSFKMCQRKFPNLKSYLNTRRRNPVKNVIRTEADYHDSAYHFRCRDCDSLRDTYCTGCGFMGYCTEHAREIGKCPLCHKEIEDFPKILIS